MVKKIREIVLKWFRRHVLSLSLISLVFLFFLVLFADRIFISVSAGHAGVLWKRFAGGTVTEETFAEGFHVIFPWNRMTIYNLRLKEATDTVAVLAKDGLKLDVEVLIRYRLDESNLGVLHKHMGANFLKVLVLPEVNSQARTVMSEFLPEEIYTVKRREIQEAIQKGTAHELRIKFRHEKLHTELVYVEDVLLKTILLPQRVRLAIEAKVEQKHRMLQYRYILQREEKERQRKEIEAQGIRKFQEIVRNGISDRYLRWKGIDATLALAKSKNAKIVIIGAGKEGMPLILGNMGANPPVETPPDDSQKNTMNPPAAEMTPMANPDHSDPQTEVAKPLTMKIIEALTPGQPDASQATSPPSNKGAGKSP
jgi:prohibitin 2